MREGLSLTARAAACTALLTGRAFFLHACFLPSHFSQIEPHRSELSWRESPPPDKRYDCWVYAATRPPPPRIVLYCLPP